MIESNSNVKRLCSMHFRNHCKNCPIRGTCTTKVSPGRTAYEYWVAKCNVAADEYIEEHGDEI